MPTLYKYNSHIAVKMGYCVECNDGILKPIIAGRCRAYHYQRYRAAAAHAKRMKRFPGLIDEHKMLWEWYEEKILELKFRCNECGSRIVNKDKKFDHWSVCHILPKQYFDSIKTHDENWIELCRQCHTLYDNYLDNHDERLMSMRIFETVISKIKSLKPFIKEHRRFNNLPLFILNKIQP